MLDKDAFIETLHFYRRAANIINKNHAVINNDNIEKLTRSSSKGLLFKHCHHQDSDYTLALSLDINPDTLLQKYQHFMNRLNPQELKPFADQQQLLNHIVICHLPLVQILIAPGKRSDIRNPSFQAFDVAMQDATIPKTLFDTDVAQRFTVAATELKLHISALAMCIEKDLNRSTKMFQYYKNKLGSINKEIVERKTQTENLNALPKPYYVGHIRSFYHMIYR